MSAVTSGGPAWEPRDRFGIALAAALMVEAVLAVAVMRFAPQAAPVATHKKDVVKIHMEAPPKPLPPPPKPMPPPPQPMLPPPPLPVAPPKPPPPKPIPRPKPRPLPRKPVPHVAPPRPQPPPPPPPPPPQPAVSAAEIESATARYAGMVHQSVQADLRVPRLVEMMHLRGIATVSIRIAPSGTLLGVSIVRSSGAPPIDRAAIASVRATSFPPFYGDMPHHPLDFVLQVKLRG
ncbi:MAG: cell envelope integrity protein TolA [Acidiphilium sp.]